MRVMTMNGGRFGWVRRIALALSIVALVGAAGFRSDEVLAQDGLPELRLVPEEMAFVGFANLRAMLDSRLWQQLRASMPVSPENQDRFETETGIRVERDIDRVLLYVAPPGPGGQPDAGFALARGRFDTAKIEALIRAHGATVEDYRGQRLFITDAPVEQAPGEGPREAVALAFVEPGLAAIGTKTLVQRAIDRQGGGANLTGNIEVMNLVRSLQGGDFWAVGRYDALNAGQRVPSAIAGQIPPIAWLALSARISSGIGGVLQVEAHDEQSADELRQVVQGFIALGKTQAPAEPGVQSLLESLELRGTGRTVALSFEAPAELLDRLAARP